MVEANSSAHERSCVRDLAGSDRANLRFLQSCYRRSVTIQSEKFHFVRRAILINVHYCSNISGLKAASGIDVVKTTLSCSFIFLSVFAEDRP